MKPVCACVRVCLPSEACVVMQAVNHPDIAVSASPSSFAVTSSSVHQAADHDSIPDIEDVARLPPDDALLPNLEDYFTTGAGSWGSATLPVKSFSGFRTPAVGSSMGTPMATPVVSPAGSSQGGPVTSPEGPVCSSKDSLEGRSVNSSKGSPVLQPNALEIIELVEAAGAPRGVLKGAAVREAGVHQRGSQGAQGGGSQDNSLCGQSMLAAVQDYEPGLQASMAAWLPQRTPSAFHAALLNSAHASYTPSLDAQASDSAPLSSAGPLGDIQHPSSLAAVESTSKALAGWMEVSLSDQHELSASQSGHDRKTLQSGGSSRRLFQYSGSAENVSVGFNNSPRILARLSSGQKPRWDAFGGWSAQVSTRGRPLTHQLSDKGKHLVEQAQSSVATAVAEVRQPQAGQVALRGSTALQQASQQLQPHVSAEATAVMQDMQLMTAGVKDATADLANRAKSWWQRHSPN